MEFKGLDDLINKLDQTAKAAEELYGEHEVSFDELFTKSFMRKYTKFSTFDELLQAGNFTVNSQKDFEDISDDDLDDHVAKTTKFSSWEDMLGKASEIYTVNKLGF